MKLKNKKTGEIGDIAQTSNNAIIVYYPIVDGVAINPQHRAIYESLAELNEEWEDAPEEPKGFWSINGDATIEHFDRLNENDLCKQIGNYFETKEEAEKVVEKLKAWKRLKDKGAKIIDYECYGGTNTKGEFLGEVKVTIDVPQEVDKYLFKLLFGGEE